MKDDRFDVVLWFKGYPERLTVPFGAIKAFWDKTELKCSDNQRLLDCVGRRVMTSSLPSL